MAEESEQRLARLVGDIRDQLGLDNEDLRFTGVAEAEADPHKARWLERRTGLGAGSLRPSPVVTVEAVLYGRAFSVGFPADLDTEDAAVRLASEIQDHVVEDLGGEPRPLCVGHPHPMSSRVVDGVAVWVCPNGQGRSRRIREHDVN